MPPMNEATQRKALGLLSLCRRAVRLTTGMEATLEKAQKGEAFLVLLAEDLSPRSAARLRQGLPEQLPVRSLPCTMQTFSTVTGKNSGILAVCDENFAGGIRAYLSDDEEDLDR